jgi:hypothetical protein
VNGTLLSDVRAGAWKRDAEKISVGPSLGVRDIRHSPIDHRVGASYKRLLCQADPRIIKALGKVGLARLAFMRSDRWIFHASRAKEINGLWAAKRKGRVS